MKTHLIMLFLCASTAGRSQVTFDIVSPAPLAGTYTHTHAQASPGGWNVPDLNEVDNRVVGELVLGLDGTEADSLCCAPLPMPSPVSGKIAVVDRGVCDYSLKAKHCQDAGALAVVIINNTAGDPVSMGPGSAGPQVSIPVIQISALDGAMIRSALLAGTTITALLGNKAGYYTDDVGLMARGMLMPQGLAYPRWLTTTAAEYHVEVAAWVYNPGQNDRTDIVLEAVVQKDGTTVYEHASPTATIAGGDSAFIVLPDFIQDGYEGDYVLTYSLSIAGLDQHAADNTVIVPFEIDDRYSLVSLQGDDREPAMTIGMQPASFTGEYESCIHFRDANAERVAVEGLHIHAMKNAPGVMNTSAIGIRVYEWLDDFTGLSDPNFSIAQMLEAAHTEYFPDDDTNRISAYVPFDAPVVLQGNARYLFCVSTFDTDIFFGYNEDLDYGTNQEIYDQPISPTRTGDNWFMGGFVGRAVPALAVQLIDANTIGMPEREQLGLTAHPNPSTGLYQLTLPVIGRTDIIVTDATGRLVQELQVSTDRPVIDLRGEAPGVYAITVRNSTGVASGRLVLE